MVSVTQRGNILHSDANVIIIPVNTVGVMGKGLALSFKQSFPHQFITYKQQCSSGKLRVGTTTLVATKMGQYACMFPTKHWRYPSRMEYIMQSLKDLHITLEEAPYIHTVAFPKVGCGCGQLSWHSVKPLIESMLSDLNVTVVFYE